jgi:CRISPR system Cascade subunit CasD
MGIARGEDISQFKPIRMGVRAEEPTYWRCNFSQRPYPGPRPERDYHTAGGDRREPREYGVPRAAGRGLETVVSYRDYLADASFTVGLESQDVEFLNRIADALRHPKWPLFLGRKAFPLTMPCLLPGDSPKPGTLEDHLLSGNSNKRVVLESPDGERTQHDWPLCFGRRRFKPRSITTRYAGGGTR